jgi:4'-phosphopantetheinyl transferase
VPEESLKRLRCLLSPDERIRASGFWRDSDRDRFVAARGWLRRLLGDELGCAAEDVPIVTTRTGKPHVPGSAVRFSFARSRDLALYATSRDSDVGVDLEAITPEADLNGVASRFFSDGERRGLASLPAAERVSAGFQAWACKEAYVKATGAGLGDAIRTVDTWRANGDPAAVAGWSIHPVAIAPGFAAAVAAAGDLETHPASNSVSEFQGGLIV